MENLKVDPDQYKKMLTELTRKITVLRVNEKSLTRRYTLLQEVEKHLRKQVDRLNKDFVEMEGAVKTKLGDLERHKVIFTIHFLRTVDSIDNPSFHMERYRAREFILLKNIFLKFFSKKNVHFW